MEKIFDSIYKLINIASGQANAEAVNNLSQETKLGFFSILKRKEFPKGYVLNTPDRICDEVYIVEKGLICNTMLIDGKEIGAGFYAEGGIGGDIISFLTRRESKRTVKLIEPSVLWVINFNDLETFYKKFPESERIARLLYNYVIIIQQQRIEDLVSESAQVRYEKLIERFPDIIPRLPLNFVATFLGITQETLSRIRAQK